MRLTWTPNARLNELGRLSWRCTSRTRMSPRRSATCSPPPPLEDVPKAMVAVAGMCSPRICWCTTERRAAMEGELQAAMAELRRAQAEEEAAAADAEDAAWGGMHPDPDED